MDGYMDGYQHGHRHVSLFVALLFNNQISDPVDCTGFKTKPYDFQMLSNYTKQINTSWTL